MFEPITIQRSLLQKPEFGLIRDQRYQTDPDQTADTRLNQLTKGENAGLTFFQTSGIYLQRP